MELSGHSLGAHVTDDASGYPTVLVKLEEPLSMNMGSGYLITVVANVSNGLHWVDGGLAAGGTAETCDAHDGPWRMTMPTFSGTVEQTH